MEISKRFQKIRKKKRLSLYNLSKATGVSVVELKKIENGTLQPTIYVLDKLMTAMNSSVSELFDDRKGSFCLTEYEQMTVDAIKRIDKK